MKNTIASAVVVMALTLNALAADLPADILLDLTRKNPMDRQRAVEAIAKHGPAAKHYTEDVILFGILQRGLVQQNQALFDASLDAVKRIHPALGAPLETWMESQDLAEVQKAIETIGQMGKDADAVVRLLIRYIGLMIDEEGKIPVFAVMALSRIEPEQEDTVKMVESILTAPDLMFDTQLAAPNQAVSRMMVLARYRELQVDAKRQVATLAKALATSYRDKVMLLEAIEQYRDHPKAMREALPAVQQAAKANSPAVRQAALRCLEQMK